ncbi:MAG: hypothetical protein H6841_03050 [Planctomycetes bacterium]|nr:hypothetical protein [Planctomycetota bacterium]MCB9934097.1 hypothetical protein [Planctomycetota bacterium]
MTRTRLFLFATIVACASALTAQQAPGPGDLAPRNGTIAYMVSDRPDALYRLFGRDDKGGWKLRSFAESMMRKQHEQNPDSEEAERDQAVFDYVFGSYEAVQRVEIALVDVTLDGPKYLVWLYTRKGETINPQPAFLKDFLAETKDYKGIKYFLYRAPQEEPPVDPDGERPRNALGDNMYGMDRYYIASTPNGLMISNFESTIRDAIDRLSSGDYSESLSGREEFAEWTKVRKPHDLSVFVIGREIQNAIERVLPSEEQAGVDAEGIYNEVDKWLQFREYKYVVFDLDYDDAARGITVAASFKTRRQTRLLEKLAIEPAEFKLLRYVPQSAMLTAGVQLGDAGTTFNNLKELGYDIEKWANEIQQGLRNGNRPPDMPPDETPPEEGMEPRSVLPGDLLKSLQELGEEGEAEPEQQSEIDRALQQLEKMLSEYGTSTDEVLSVLGSEVIVFVSPNIERARAHGRSGMDVLMNTGDVGIAIGLKDVAKAKALLAAAREKDPEGAFRGMTEVGYQGTTFQISGENPYGYAFTEDALLIVVSAGVIEEDATQPVIAGLKAMVDASTRTVTGNASFVKNGSKFIEFDFGGASRITNQLSEDLSRRLDRYAEPPLEKDPTSFMTDLTFALRLKEYKDGVELAIRVAGLPDFGQFLDGEASVFGGGGAKRNAYNYSEDNLRTLSSALHTRADNDHPIDFEAMLSAGEIRKGALQVPFDARWKGGIDKLGWTTLDQVVRDSEGNLPEWVNKDAADVIEANEKEGFRSIVLAKGDLATWLTAYQAGFIVAYQEQADTLGGHVVLYADGQIGWLAADALKQALELNAKGEPVPAEDNWKDEGYREESGRPKGTGPRIKEDDPWFPGPKDDK